MAKNVYVYSRGEFNALSEEFLIDKAIIRIHNIKDKNWYPERETNRLILFFEDIKLSDFSFKEKIYYHLSKKIKIKILLFIVNMAKVVV